MNLIIDIGNSITKVAVFEQENLLELHHTKSLNIGFLEKLLKVHACDKGILSSVKDYPLSVGEWLNKHLNYFLVFSTKSKLPFQNEYTTNTTLGHDRIAAVAGAYYEFPGRNVLIIDMGTCITYDLLTANGIYKGGSISPGVYMRLKAMHSFTGKLPKLKFEVPGEVPAAGTKDAMLTGVYWGIVHEVNGFVEKYKQQYNPLEVILTGGDGKHFDFVFKSEIFAVPNLVLTGLNKILEYNAE